MFLSSRWEEFPAMNTPRCLFGFEWIPDGRLFAVGGYGGDREPTASVEMLCELFSNRVSMRMIDSKNNIVGPFYSQNVPYL